MVEALPRHEWSLNWLKRVHHREIEAVVSAHSLLELYAVLTRLPLRPPIPASIAWEMVQRNLQGKVEVRALTAGEYWHLLPEISQSGAVGGRSYDWLVGYAGTLAQVEAIVTLNPRHFTEMGKRWNLSILTPRRDAFALVPYSDKTQCCLSRAATPNGILFCHAERQRSISFLTPR